MWTLDTIRDLAEESGEILATIYIPTHVAGREIQQDPIRLKNAVQALEREAEGRGLDHQPFQRLIEHPKALIGAGEFWRHQSLGLALFCRPAGMRVVKLPFVPPEIHRLGERFHVAPLLRGAGDTRVFHLLSVNRKGSTLYDIAGDQIAERPIEPMLDSLEAARGMSDYDAEAGFHSDATGGPRGKGPDGTPRYHALGTGTDEQEEIELERYLGSIARAVDQALGGSAAPLVLAGGDRVVGRIRQMLKAPGLCEGHVSRNTAGVEAGTLAEAAREIVEAETPSPVRDAFETLQARLASGEGTASSDYRNLMEAASEGRVDVAFLDLQQSAEGAEVDEQHSRMLDSLAVEVLRHGGRVYPLPGPAGRGLAPAAGLLRY